MQFTRDTCRNSLNNSWSTAQDLMVPTASDAQEDGQIKPWVGLETTVSHSREATHTEVMTNLARDPVENSVLTEL